MKHRVKLPSLSKETLSEIAYGMENQEFESVFCLDDGNVYPSEMLEEYFDDVEQHRFVRLPDWSSSDGYRLMCSFVQVCDDEDLRKELSEALNAGPRGVFRRFRSVLEHHGDAVTKWYEFKDRKMGAYILAWYRGMVERRDIGPKEEGGDDLLALDVMVDYDIVHEDSLDAGCVGMIERVVTDPVARRVLDAFPSKEAFCVYKGGMLCGQLAFEVVGDAACVLFYYIEEPSRGIGLFSVLFDMFNRELERRGVCRVVSPVPNAVFDFAAVLADHDVECRTYASVSEYRVADWNGAVESSEVAYII